MSWVKKVFLLVILTLFCGLTAFAVSEKMMSVQMKKAFVRKNPKMLGKIVAKLVHGDRVQVLEEQDNWIKVSDSKTGKTGWMNKTSLTPKEIVLKAGDKDVKTSASQEEVALAGKGFNEKVEKEYKSRNPKTSFVWIDRMVKMNVPENKMKTFLKTGGLSLEGGDK